MIMLFFISTKVVILMQIVSRTVIDSFSIKYWLTSVDKIVKFLLKLRKNSGDRSNIASTITNTVCGSQNFCSVYSLIDQQLELI